jgi:hypothetical protein
MSEGVLGIGHLGFASTPEWEQELPRISNRSGGWSSEKFAREQIRGLVRMVFSASAPKPVRQVVFSAVDASTDVRNLCMSVADTLAAETLGDIAILGGYAQIVRDDTHAPEYSGRVDKNRGASLHQTASHIRSNVWQLPVRQGSMNCVPASSTNTYLGEIRREFEYSIIAAPSAQESGEALAMSQFADGIILVLSAQSTRRATARRIKDQLDQSHVRLLGTVLGDREFPIPTGLYRRL